MAAEAEDRLQELREIEMKLADIDRRQREAEEERARLVQRRLDILGLGGLAHPSRLEKPNAASSKDWQRILNRTAFGRRK